MPVVAVHSMGTTEWREKDPLQSTSPANALSPYSPAYNNYTENKKERLLGDDELLCQVAVIPRNK